MAPLDEVLRRYAEDTQFRNLLDTDPASALREYPLTPEELGRVEDAVRAAAPPAEPSPPTGAGRARAARGSRAALAAGVGIAALAGGFALGATGAVADQRPEVVVARDAVPVHACPTGEPDAGELPAAVGELHRADRVLVVGRSNGGGWLAVRDPRDLTGPPIWVQTPYLRPDRVVDGVPVRSCEEVADPETAPPASDQPRVTTTVPVDGSTTTASIGATTTTARGGVAPPTPTTPTTSTSTTASTKPTPTTPPDTTGPDVQITPERTFVYTDGSTEQSCSSKAAIDVTVAANDPSAPVTIGTVTWRHTGRDGSNRTGTATALGGGRYRVSGLTNQVPLQGTTPLTITATATDGRGNTASGTTTISLKAFSDDCIG